MEASVGQHYLGTLLLHVTEMKMLKRMCGVTQVVRIRYLLTRGRHGVHDLADKLQERRVGWYGHVMRRSEDYVGRRCLYVSFPGTRLPGRSRKQYHEAELESQWSNPNDQKDLAKWRILKLPWVGITLI